MGVKNLLRFLKTQYPNCIEKKHVSFLKNQTLCIDTPGLIYKCKFSTTEGKNCWVNCFLNFILKMLQNDVDLVFILEGPPINEKKATQELRIKNKKAFASRTLFLKELIQKYYTEQELTSELLQEWKKMQKSEEIPFNPEIFSSKITKRESYNEPVTSEDYKLVTEILKSLNVPFLKSPTEAETLCAFLEASKKVSYIFSNDSDVLAYKGVKGFISEFDWKTNQVIFYNKTEILKVTNLCDDSFIDFCIIAGVDYNTSLKSVGIVSAFRLISAFDEIENIPTFTDDNKNQLKFQWVRDKFNLKEFQDSNFEIEFHFKEINQPLFDSVIKENNVRLYGYILDMIEKTFEIPRDFYDN